MAIATPVILLPSGGVDYTTDTPIQTLSGTTSSNTNQIRVNNSLSGVSYTPGDSDWSWTGTLSVGQNTYSITAVENLSGTISTPAIINITLSIENTSITVSSPTGVSLKRYQDKIEIITSQNPETNVQGYNFYVSYQSGGVNNQYVKINSALVPNTIASASFYLDSVTQIGETIETVGQLRTTTITEQVIRNYYFSVFFDQPTYNTFVTNGQLPNTGFSQNVDFYFVVTAVIFDSILGQVSESSYSPELEGSPVTITTGIQDLPGRTQNDIILTYGQELNISNPNVDIKPGTVLRDTINPLTEEQYRIYIIQDFFARSLSVSALLDFDDPNNTGTSQPVNQSPKKQALQLALYLSSADQVQKLIDDQFDKLASNVNITRIPAQSAVGTVTFYTQNAPIRDMAVTEGAQVSSVGDGDQGIPSQAYRCLETKVLPYADRASYYNPLTQRYELVVDVEAINAGSAGNTDSYTIKSISSGADSGFLVENPNPIQFGTDLESNNDLSARLELAFFADTGTAGGYAKTAISVPGVHGVRVEKAGDSLMFRDYDSVRKEHIGGKVDIYVQGKRIKQVADQIAFSYTSSTNGTLQGERFDVISAISFQFKTENPLVTANTPIFEVDQVYNATRGKSYDLTGYIIFGDGDSIELNANSQTNILIGLSTSDIVQVNYKYRSSDVFILENQPVESIVSVVGQLSGPLTSDNWDLVKLQDPLEDGYSTNASDGIRIKFANNLPLTDFQTITDEPHVIIQGVSEKLNLLGIDPNSIIVTSQDKSVTYAKNADYTMTSGTGNNYTTITMIDTGLIVSGQTVLVSYVAIENFTVTYTTNGLLSDVQTQVNLMKHACADVIVKEAILNSVNFQITVVPKSGVTNLEQVSSQIQTAVANYISQVGVGVSVSQSDVDYVIRTVPDVDYVVLPFVRMVKADGSLIARDDVGSPTFKIFSQGVATAYTTTIPVLTYKTTANGGSTNLFRGVFENEIALVLQTDPLSVAGGPGRAYIQPDGTIVVSTSDGNLPETKDWQVAYYTSGESGSKDIQVASLEYLQVGTFIITYDQPRALGHQIL
jgi:Baseplate J-like protein